MQICHDLFNYFTLLRTSAFLSLINNSVNIFEYSLVGVVPKMAKYKDPELTSSLGHTKITTLTEQLSKRTT